jgi:hypothetical protein
VAVDAGNRAVAGRFPRIDDHIDAGASDEGTEVTRPPTGSRIGYQGLLGGKSIGTFANSDAIIVGSEDDGR